MIILTEKERQEELKSIKAYVKEETKKMTKKDAIKILYETGMYTESGNLKKEFSQS